MDNPITMCRLYPDFLNKFHLASALWTFLQKGAYSLEEWDFDKNVLFAFLADIAAACVIPIMRVLFFAKGAYAFLIHACDVRGGFFWQIISQEEGFYDVFRANPTSPVRSGL